MMLKVLTQITLVVGERVRTSWMLFHIQITKFDPTAHLHPTQPEPLNIKCNYLSQHKSNFTQINVNYNNHMFSQ